MTLPPSLPKPLHGSPCNSCGRCCHAELWPLGAHVFGHSEGPCPALQPAEGGALVCGLVVNPMRYALRRSLAAGSDAMSTAAAYLIGAGHGCDAQTVDEPRDFAFSARMRAHGASTRTAARAAAAKWGVTFR